MVRGADAEQPQSVRQYLSSRADERESRRRKPRIFLDHAVLGVEDMKGFRQFAEIDGQPVRFERRRAEPQHNRVLEEYAQ